MKEQMGGTFYTVFCVMTDQGPHVTVPLPVTATDPQPWTEAVIEAISWRPSYCHSFIATGTQSKCFSSPFYLLWDPAEVNQQSWK